jgi:hypothetical protein
MGAEPRNTVMQAVLDRWANRRLIVPPELTGRIAPTRLEGINLRGVFRFPVERCAYKLRLACVAHTVDGKDILGEIDTNVPNSHGFPHPSE